MKEIWLIFTHLKLWVAVARHNFRWVKSNLLRSGCARLYSKLITQRWNLRVVVWLVNFVNEPQCDFYFLQMRPQSVYLWITLINLVSTFTSIYGLVVMQRACLPVLMKFRMIPKFVSYPLMLVFTILPSIIVNFLVVQGVIPCTPLLPSKVRGDRECLFN